METITQFQTFIKTITSKITENFGNCEINDFLEDFGDIRITFGNFSIHTRILESNIEIEITHTIDKGTFNESDHITDFTCANIEQAKTIIDCFLNAW